MGLRDGWAASFKPPQELHRLEYDKERNLALYVSKTKVIQDKWNPKNNTEDPFGRAPVYHVWKGNDWLYCGPDMRAAYNKYNDQKKQEVSLVTPSMFGIRDYGDRYRMRKDDDFTDWDVVRYGTVVDDHEFTAGGQYAVRLKTYTYRGRFFTELWCDGIRQYYGECI